MSLLLDEKILAVQRAFTAAGIPHAFGGALALAYHATPRGTIDIDVNVFLPVSGAERVFAALEPLGVAGPSASERAKLAEHAQVRIFWERTPLDLFFAYDPLHDACLERSREVPFGDGATLRVLSAEDLAVFKVLFDRRKDWTDLEELLFAQGGDFDAGYACDWLGRILEPGDARLERFRGLLEGRDES